MKVEQSKMNLVQKAKARPDQVRQVLDTARTLGWRSAYEKVKNRLESPTPLGYSAAGEVVEVDAGNTRFRVGDQVAIGGAECAFHAEYCGVPDLLAARIPRGVENWEAAYTTLCSIALQAVRQGETRVGERALVIGQGLVGLLTTAILQASGVRVLATDLDVSRLEISKVVGAERVVGRGGDLLSEVNEWTDGYGVDQVFYCIGGNAEGPVRQAVSALRDRGTMVIVGIANVQLEWKTVYMKELQVRYSRSYGPGRYDPAYEWGGQDYPIGYVRWTEQRNFDACLELMRSNRLDLASVTTRRARFDDILHVYEDLMKEGNADIGVVLEYGDASKNVSEATTNVPLVVNGFERVGANNTLDRPVEAIDVVGAGNFVKTMLLPQLKGLPFGKIANQTALSTRHVKEKFSFGEAVADSEKIFSSSEGNRAVLIGTRHHLHAPMVVSALRSHRHVFVEKPLCLKPEELGEIEEALSESQGSVMVGFNRRFAPATQELRKVLETVPGPKSISFRVFAGTLKPDHWYANYEESGGRVLGEACHFFDFFCYLLSANPIRVFASPIGPSCGRLPFPDSISAMVEFADGSSGQLIYSGEGDTSYPKETFTVYGGGLVASCENFQRLTIHRRRKAERSKYTSKGHAEEMAAWKQFLSAEGDHPLPYEEARTSMLLTFGALESIQRSASVSLKSPEQLKAD